jgi:hypothetical protein
MPGVATKTAIRNVRVLIRECVSQLRDLNIFRNYFPLAVARVLRQHSLMGLPVIANLVPEPPDLVVVGDLHADARQDTNNNPIVTDADAMVVAETRALHLEVSARLKPSVHVVRRYPDSDARRMSRST